MFVYLGHKAEGAFTCLRCLNNTVQTADGRRRHLLYVSEVMHFVIGIQ